MSNGKSGNRKNSPENMKRAQDALKAFATVKQKYGDPEELDAGSIGDIRAAYDAMTNTFNECSLKPGKDTQQSIYSYMQRVDARYAALQHPAEEEKIIDAEVIDDKTPALPEQDEDYQTIAPEADEPAYDAPVPKTATEADLRAQAKEKYKHFDESIERIGKWLEDARARNEERKARAEKERAEDAARNAAGS